MKNKQLIIISFIIIALIQLAVPAYMIYRYEDTLKTGTLYKFRTAPVDPYDAFRGRYVFLSFDDMEVTAPKGLDPNYNETIFATLKKDKNDFATIDKISKERPSEDNYIEAKMNGYGIDPKKVRVFLNIDRYYMEEDQAPRAEAVYNEANRAGAKKAYVTVRVKKGYPVIDGLFIENMPIKEYMEKSDKSSKK